MFSKIQQLRSNETQESGFTLIELLVVILIIGILAAIAIPLFLNQRKAANDASLQADVKSAATQVETWLVKNAGTKEFVQQTGKRNAIVEGTGAVNGYLPAQVRWNDVATLPKISVGNGVTLEVIFNDVAQGIWTQAHEDGEFCIAAVKTNSTWDRIPLSGASNATYDHMLFYDVKAGGMRTMEQLVNQFKSTNVRSSCYAHVESYLAAT